MTNPPPSVPEAPRRPAWQRNLPNVLTLARVAMTAAFVAVLSIYRFPDSNAWALPAALILFIVAALTDALDGYLARRWNVVSVFGRIMDPFADKILILGAFVMLAGPQFWVDVMIHVYAGEFTFKGPVTGIAPWMVVVILGRELLVTTIRAVLESQGIDFSASLTGKIKMIAQTLGVAAILLLSKWALNGFGIASQATGVLPDSSIEEYSFDKGCFCAGLAWLIALAVTLITAASAIPYITRAITALRKPA